MTTDNLTEQMKQYSATKLCAAEKREWEYLNTPSSLDHLVNSIITLEHFGTKIKAFFYKPKTR